MFKWIFAGGHWHYVTSAPCGKCGESSELTLSDEDYLLFLENDGTYNHAICPKDY